MPAVASYVVVQDNELLVESDAPDREFAAFDAPDAVEELPAVMNFRVRPDVSRGPVRIDLRLNGRVVGADSFFDSGKRGWTEVVPAGVLAPTGNTLSVRLLSPDASPAPDQSQVGIAEVSLFYSVQTG